MKLNMEYVDYDRILKDITYLETIISWLKDCFNLKEQLYSRGCTKEVMCGEIDKTIAILVDIKTLINRTE